MEVWGETNFFLLVTFVINRLHLMVTLSLELFLTGSGSAEIDNQKDEK